MNEFSVIETFNNVRVLKKEIAAQIVGTVDFRTVGQSDHQITKDEHDLAVEVGFELAKKHGIDLAAHIAGQIESEKRYRGRPEEMIGGKRVNVYLDADSLAAADRIGGGNVSEGIRIALANSPDRS